MNLEVINHPKTGVNEVLVDGVKIGVFEQMDCGGAYSFMSKCAHEKLTGDHYILIGQHLNKFNSKAS